MRKHLSGLGTLTDPSSGTVRERATFTCGHCNSIRHVKPMCDPADLGGLCKICMTVVCEKCVGHGCDPFEEKLKRQEASYHARRHIEQASR